jgi:hypothetical protein
LAYTTPTLIGDDVAATLLIPSVSTHELHSNNNNSNSTNHNTSNSQNSSNNNNNNQGDSPNLNHLTQPPPTVGFQQHLAEDRVKQEVFTMDDPPATVDRKYGSNEVDKCGSKNC